MQFNSNVVSEIIIPNNVPFEPGNDVIGIGFSVPPELAAIGFIAAIIFYNSQWHATDTEARVVYQFIAAGSAPDPIYQTAVSIGYVWQANPSVNSPKLVAQSATAGAIAPTASGYAYLSSIFTVENHNGNTVLEVTETDANGDSILALFNNAGNHQATKSVGTTTPTNTWGVV